MKLKEAIITPLLKNPSLDSEKLMCYRPVSGLPYLGKLMEKAAVSQLGHHMNNNNLHNPVQSAYRTGHSNETALVKIVNDMARNEEETQERELISSER